MQYPPVISDCPDYWLDRSDGDGSNCRNLQKLGRTNCAKTMDFSGAYWTGQDGLCNKNKGQNMQFNMGRCNQQFKCMCYTVLVVQLK